jgi:copper(I)-binding protein
MRILLLITALCLLMAPSVASSHSTQSGDVAIGHIWAYPAQSVAEQTGFYMRGMPAGNTIDVFGPLLNGGDTADALTGVTSDGAQSAGIVRWIRGQQMVQNFPVSLPPGKPVAFGPQTVFIRLYGVSAAAKAGDKFPVTLHFQRAPEATIDVIVQAR